MRFFQKTPQHLSLQEQLRNRSKKHRFWWYLWRFLVAGFALSIVTIIATFLYFSKDLPNPNTIKTRAVTESTKIFDRTGNHLLYEIHGEEKRTIIPLSDIPQTVRAATITLEDRDFYNHGGIQLVAILRAVYRDITGGRVAQGGSTITQQFIKNSLLTNEKTFTRKIKEVILSIELERKYSKDEILGMYLNEIPYGSNAYGVQAASQTFFGKDSKDLSLDESALLASLPNAPTYYSPYGLHTDALNNRKDKALTQMANLGYITQEQADEAIASETLEKIIPQREAIAAPHFVMYVKERLVNTYGEQALEQNGMKIYTTLDWDKQQAAEQAIADGTPKNDRYKASNAALISTDPKTGQILAMVGSRNYFDTKIDGQVNVALSPRQPGSSFKPFVYLDGFTKGYLPETILNDVQTNFSTDTDKEYTPQNYNGKFNGPLSIKKALGGSLNIPAVKMLYLVGVRDAVSFAKNLGITTLNRPDQYGLSLVLGGGEVKLIDHVAAYGTLATGGIKHDQISIIRVEDAKSNVLEQYTPSDGTRVVDEKYVAMLDSVISNSENRDWVFGAKNPLDFPDRQVAAKTGTTNEFRDAWTIGYTPSLVAGVWVGNNDNTSMSTGADGSVVAGPIWRAYMDKVLGNMPKEDFPTYNPDDYIGDGDGKTNKPMLNGQMEENKNVKVCEIPGKNNGYCIANKYCPDSEVEKKTFLNAHSILFYVDRADPAGPIPSDPSKDPQYKEWEKNVQKWYDKNSDKVAKHAVIDTAPTDECKENDFLSQFKPSVSISAPASATSATFTVSASADAPYGVDSLTISVNGNKVGSSNSNSVSASYTPSTGDNGSTLKVEASLKDDNGNTASDTKNVSVSF
ncbi:MAG: PBP1A family penicillin-binding protein [Candidatus Moraniibacteriota bacterium]